MNLQRLVYLQRQEKYEDSKIIEVLSQLEGQWLARNYKWKITLESMEELWWRNSQLEAEDIGH